jgi:hypothetical protein
MHQLRPLWQRQRRWLRQRLRRLQRHLQQQLQQRLQMWPLLRPYVLKRKCSFPLRRIRRLRLLG